MQGAIFRVIITNNRRHNFAGAYSPVQCTLLFGGVYEFTQLIPAPLPFILQANTFKHFHQLRNHNCLRHIFFFLSAGKEAAERLVSLAWGKATKI
jgi:hypothetical protein